MHFLGGHHHDGENLMGDDGKKKRRKDDKDKGRNTDKKEKHDKQDRGEKEHHHRHFHFHHKKDEESKVKDKKAHKSGGKHGEHEEEESRRHGIGHAIGGLLGTATKHAGRGLNIGAREVGKGLHDFFVDEEKQFEVEAERDRSSTSCCQWCAVCRCCELLLTGMVCAAVITPILFAIGVVPLIISEVRAGCRAWPHDFGRAHAQEINCYDSQEVNLDGLSIFRCEECNLEPTSIVPAGGPTLDGDFASERIRGVGVRTHVEVFQCVEHKEYRRTRQRLGGEIYTPIYTYKMRWLNQFLDTSEFAAYNSPEFIAACGVNRSNPPWDFLPTPGTVFAESVKVREFVLSQAILSKVPLDLIVTPFPAPAGWRKSGNSYYSPKLRPYTELGDAQHVALSQHTGSYDIPSIYTTTVTTTMHWNNYEVSGKRIRSGSAIDFDRPELGDARVTFMTNDPWYNDYSCTMLVKNTEDADGYVGYLDRYQSGRRGFCPEFSFGAFRYGTWPEDQLFGSIEIGADSWTWAIRICCFVMFWFAICGYCMFLGFAGAFMPCISLCVGNCVEPAAMVLAFCPALICVFGVIGLPWIFVSPFVAIFMVLPMLAMAGLFVAFFFHNRMMGYDIYYDDEEYYDDRGRPKPNE